MATDPLERAVIEAARQLYHEGPEDDWAKNSVILAMGKLIEAEESRERGTEIEWHELAEGDQLRSAKTGLFWEVIAVQKIKDGYQIGIRKDDKRALITRPTEAEPTAWVKRGPTGQIVDSFVTVWSSGGK
jgi:hypothetical protein